MNMTIPAAVSLVFAGVAAVFYAVNQRFFKRAPLVEREQLVSEPRPVSVLIPARNEEQLIRQTLQRVLASTGVHLEVLVLDDHSTDRTCAIIEEVAETDSRVRVLRSAALPSGWCGKQHACQQLANAATYDDFVFLDADVSIQPDAVQRAVSLRHELGLDLLSGFPAQRAETFGEQLLLPLINYILLCYLPFWSMRGSTRQSASAGCGQFFITHRAAYQQVGGHASIRSSLHDGITLPRVYRKHSLTTDIFDASDLACVRMYRGFAETWRGLSKNAAEGVANFRLIIPVTALMFGAHVFPVLLLSLACVGMVSTPAAALALVAEVFSLIPRLATALRFDRAWIGVLLHPLAITVFLAIQWAAWVRSIAGHRSVWRGRTCPAIRNAAP